MLMLFSLFSCVAKEVPEDGGHHSYTDVDAPKEIVSTELTGLNCDCVVEDDENEIYGRYCLEVKKEDGSIRGSYEFREADSPLNSIVFPFETGDAFMDRLEEIIRRHDIAQYNGIHEETIGIADEYGFSFDAAYASGEEISCSDNAASLLSLEFVRELAELFYQESGASAYYDTDRLQNLRYSIYDKENGYRFTAYIYEDADGTVRYRLQEKQDDTVMTEHRGETEREVLERIQKICEDNGMYEISEYPRREESGYCALEMKSGKTDSHIRSNTAISDEQLKALYELKDLILKECSR